jgi:hypothetical protein
LAPVMVVDGEYHGGLTPDSAVELLQKIAARDKPLPSETEAGGRKRAGRRSKKSEHAPDKA